MVKNKHRNKADLPEKLCIVCKRPFSWRKKWARCWDEVKYCSRRCAGNKKTSVVKEIIP